MLDYKQIEALAKVIQEGGFERAAQALYLTQSAVSQRVRQLEETSGQILISRTTPPQPTVAGKALLKHYQQVKLLEEGLSADLPSATKTQKTSFAIGINADSLAHWFIAAIDPLLQRMDLLLDLRVDDQEQTHHYLREGDVVGCISTEANAIQGCRIDKLGSMNYRLVATADFTQRYFPNGLTQAEIELAPAVIFNRKDRLHHHFLQQVPGILPKDFPAHNIPAPDQFLQFITAGYGYGMVPDWQGQKLIESGQLQELAPEISIRVDLYWHCWNLTAQPLQEFSNQLVSAAKQILTD